MVVLSISVPGDLWGVGRLLTGRKVIYQQGDDRSGAGDEPGRVDPKVEIVFHIAHGALHALMQPILEPPGVFIQAGGLRDAAMLEPELAAPLFDQNCMLRF